MTLTFGSLFAGVGGLDLGLERAGLECRWQVEMDDYAQKVLAHHWPDVPRYNYVQGFLGGKRWRRVRAAWYVDVVCGGFPCQDISNAGKREGIDGKRSGLWSEFARVIRLLRPRYVVVENVPALTIRGLGRVLGDLAAIGYDAEWGCIPAAALGAPHPRWRLFLVADRRPGSLDVFGYGVNADGDKHEGRASPKQKDRAPSTASGAAYAPYAHSALRQKPEDQIRPGGPWLGGIPPQHAPNPDGSGREKPQQVFQGKRITDVGHETPPSDADSQREQQSQGGLGNERRRLGDVREDLTPDAASRWAGQRWRHEFQAYCERTGRLFWPGSEPGVCGVATGIPKRVDRLRCLGNAVVPQIAEWIGRRLLNKFEILKNSS